MSYEDLAAFAAGDLDAEGAERIEQHARTCAACRTRLAALRRVDGGLRLMPRAEPSAGAVLAARRLVARETRGAGGPEIMTLSEVAEFLRVPPDALADVADDLPAFEIGGQVRVRRARLIEWVAERERSYASSRAETEVARALAGLW
jgi:anti-sigma factor RsiW